MAARTAGFDGLIWLYCINYEITSAFRMMI